MDRYSILRNIIKKNCIKWHFRHHINIWYSFNWNVSLFSFISGETKSVIISFQISIVINVQTLFHTYNQSPSNFSSWLMSGEQHCVSATHIQRGPVQKTDSWIHRWMSSSKRLTCYFSDKAQIMICTFPADFRLYKSWR